MVIQERSFNPNTYLQLARFLKKKTGTGRLQINFNNI